MRESSPGSTCRCGPQEKARRVAHAVECHALQRLLQQDQHHGVHHRSQLIRVGLVLSVVRKGCVRARRTCKSCSSLRTFSSTSPSASAGASSSMSTTTPLLLTLNRADESKHAGRRGRERRAARRRRASQRQHAARGPGAGGVATAALAGSEQRGRPGAAGSLARHGAWLAPGSACASVRAERHVNSRHVTSRHVTSRHVMSRHVTSRHVKSRHGSCNNPRGLVLVVRKPGANDRRDPEHSRVGPLLVAALGHHALRRAVEVGVEHQQQPLVVVLECVEIRVRRTRGARGRVTSSIDLNFHYGDCGDDDGRSISTRHRACGRAAALRI